MVIDNTTKTISMFRGETGGFTITFTGFTLDEDTDRVIFTASKDDNGKKPFFTKVLVPSDNAVEISFEISDTKDIQPGEYYYELEFGVVADEEDGKIVDVDYENGGAHLIARPIGAECYRFIIYATPAQIGINGGLNNV